MLSIFIMLPLAAAFLASLAGRFHRRVVEAIVSAACLMLAAMSCLVISKVGAHGLPVVCRFGGVIPGAGISFIADGFSAYILAIANIISLAVALYSVNYMKRYTDTWKYYTLFMIMVAGVNGVILTGDIFNMFVFLEIASISVYALVAFGTEDGALEASFKYAVMGSVASSFLLLGIAFIYSYTSALSLSDISGAIAARPGAMVVRFVSALFLAGLGLKAALAPFHAWMPDAYSKSPAPVPAMSSGVLVKALGAYALARLFFNVFGITGPVSGVFIALGVISMVLGGVMAFGQANLKRLLGFSSISQLGYIFLGFGIATPLSITAALFHLLNHSVAKSLLFMGAGEMEDPDGNNTLGPASANIAARPMVKLSSLAGALSLCGVPPFAGFWSKLLIILACIQAKRPGLAFIAVAVSILTLGYYFKAYSPIVSGKNIPGAVGDTASGRPVALANFVLFALAMAALFGGILLLPGSGKIFVSQASSVLVKGLGYINTGALALK